MTVSRLGLDGAEARKRLAEFGPNELEPVRARSVAAIVLGALREPMFLLLLGASALYLLLGDLGEGLFLTIGACMTIGLVVVQEARSERALKALRALAEPFVRVVRGGQEQQIPARDLVPGDVMLVGEGERLAADGVLVAGDMLAVDESTLTGESATVAKSPDPGAAAEGRAPKMGEEVGPWLFAGTLIASGHGVAEVAATGARTALGRIGSSLASIADEPTPLQRTAGRLVGLLGAFALAFCVLLAAAYGLLRGDWVEGTLAGVTVAIALIPEEFPMVLAVFLALGAWRLAQHKVLVRRAATIEALGGSTLLCVDKTGTLTENRMRVAELWAGGHGHEIVAGPAMPEAMRELVAAAALASSARSVDAMDRAVVELRGRAGPPDTGFGGEPQRTWPLRPERPAVIQLWVGEDGRSFAAAKGAPEAIFRLCRLTPDETAALQGVLDGLAEQGLRVLAVAASAHEAAFPEQPEDAAFAFRGFLGFVDPLRPDVPAALEEARRAGISVAMITGDYPATALAIARQAGISVDAGVLTGAELAELEPEVLQARLAEVRVFARVQPDQKLRLVEVFKANGEIVVMTGDGVNDAPALEAAHIGVAMGKRGTDVAREAADLVLLDDSFVSIVGGVRLGRRIFANLRKALTYITAIHVPIAGLALAPILMGLPPLLTPVHVVLLELVIDPVCSLVFEAEPSETDAMRRPPRDPRETLFGPRQIAFALAQGAVVLVAVLGLYAWALEIAPEAQARGAAFAALVVANLTLAFSDSATARVRLFDRRRLVFWAIAAAAATVLGAVLFAPPLEAIFRVASPPPHLLLATIVVAIGAGGWIRLVGALRRLSAPTGPATAAGRSRPR